MPTTTTTTHPETKSKDDYVLVRKSGPSEQSKCPIRHPSSTFTDSYKQPTAPTSPPPTTKRRIG
jgi:hypothetical protein